MMRPLAVALLVACSGDRTGTSVGNPSKTLLKLAPPGDGIVLDEAQIEVTTLTVDGEELAGPGLVDLIEGAPLGISLDQVSVVELSIEGAITIQGIDAGDGIDLELVVPAVRSEASRQALEPGIPHIFELAYPAWLSASEVGWMVGEDHVVRPGDAEHDALVLAVTQRSSLLGDADGDGVPER